ncbi:aminotransferase class I/II-fold pyridoxal phosphate-dependent enzyme [Bacillus salipaludis]|uniref:Aminotransferase class I/II-fold pyridoxal phosphate-dependent enzyme n=1 Tax=Bacillus salipaludis TaxID=2547811 RepID=A0AA90Z5N1_9BACI|nr:aminotransferase class I/II-fold pyridoxal phosphate-dependent enzyme [Bacillus salipaludis]MDQ6601073.1 aminotransferase class I/II-fold pyridoxal phosphate-dependent enzyme [Bacillus salipaludis]
MLNPLALELNHVIEERNKPVYEMFSLLGKSLYFPKGIVSQAGEARGKADIFNATIGMATKGGQPIYLDVIHKNLSGYDPKDLYPYAPPAGKPELREVWRKKLLKDNPSLEGKDYGIPIVTSGLTHGLSIVSDLFVDKGDSIILPDKYWDNYQILFNVRHGSETVTYPLFTKANEFNVEGLLEALLSCKNGKAILVLNFPHNPTGYTPTEKEAEEILEAIREAADYGINIVAVMDDAYFGLYYEDSIKESIFARLVGLHPRVLPIKVDGATKEEYAWGFRVGFLTFGTHDPLVLDALEKKAMGSIRSTISCSPHLSQTIILDALLNPEFEMQRNERNKVMEDRAKRVKEILADGKYADEFEPYPFNSGYFVSLKINNSDAEALRVHLLNQYGVGTVSLAKTDLRIAFSCVELNYLDCLFELIYQSCKELNPCSLKL